MLGTRWLLLLLLVGNDAWHTVHILLIMHKYGLSIMLVEMLQLEIPSGRVETGRDDSYLVPFRSNFSSMTFYREREHKTIEKH